MTFPTTSAALDDKRGAETYVGTIMVGILCYELCWHGTNEYNLTGFILWIVNMQDAKFAAGKAAALPGTAELYSCTSSLLWEPIFSSLWYNIVYTGCPDPQNKRKLYLCICSLHRSQVCTRAPLVACNVSGRWSASVHVLNDVVCYNTHNITYVTFRLVKVVTFELLG